MNLNVHRSLNHEIWHDAVKVSGTPKLPHLMLSNNKINNYASKEKHNILIRIQYAESSFSSLLFWNCISLCLFPCNNMSKQAIQLSSLL